MSAPVGDEELDPSRARVQRDGAHALGRNLLLGLDLGAEQGAPARDRSVEIRDRDAHMVQVTGGHDAHRATMGVLVDPFEEYLAWAFWTR